MEAGMDSFNLQKEYFHIVSCADSDPSLWDFQFEKLHDFLGNIVLSDQQSTVRLEAVPVIEFLHQMSRGVSKALFSSENETMGLEEIGIIFRVEVSSCGQLSLSTPLDQLTFDLVSFCNEIGQLQYEILLMITEVYGDPVRMIQGGTELICIRKLERWHFEKQGNKHPLDV